MKLVRPQMKAQTSSNPAAQNSRPQSAPVDLPDELGGGKVESDRSLVLMALVQRLWESLEGLRILEEALLERGLYTVSIALIVVSVAREMRKALVELRREEELKLWKETGRRPIGLRMPKTSAGSSNAKN